MSSSGPLFAFLASVTWAIGSAGYSKIAQRYSPFSVNFARGLIALPLFLLASFASAGGWSEGIAAFSALTREQISWFALSMFASYGFGDVLFLWSTRSIGVPAALAIASSYPLWTALSGFVFHGEVLSLKQVLGLFLAIAGVIVVILSAPRAPQISGKGAVRRPALSHGVILAFITSFFWATNSFAVAHVGKNISPPVGNSIRMIVALVLSFGLSRLMRQRDPILLPFVEFRRWLWLFALEAFGGSYFFMYGLSHSTLAVGSTLASLAPVLSVPVAWGLGLEKISRPRILGICSAVSGVTLLLAEM